VCYYFKVINKTDHIKIALKKQKSSKKLKFFPKITKKPQDFSLLLGEKPQNHGAGFILFGRIFVCFEVLLVKAILISSFFKTPLKKIIIPSPIKIQK
jgi:hypothetical protein